MESKNYLVLESGWDAIMANPFDKEDDFNSYCEFEDSISVPIPLTVQQTPGEVIKAKLVWQTFDEYDITNGDGEWINIDFPEYVSMSTVLDGYDNKRQALQPVLSSTDVEKPNDWIKIAEDNLPHDLLICDWKHPEYGIIKGNIVRYAGQRPDYKESQWIFPDGGNEADIALSEFTHYRKLKKLPSVQPIPTINPISQGETIEQLAAINAGTLYSCYPFPNDNYSYLAVRLAYTEGAKFGYNKRAEQQNKDVVELIEARINALSNKQGGQYATFALNELTYLLKDIGNKAK